MRGAGQRPQAQRIMQLFGGAGRLTGGSRFGFVFRRRSVLGTIKRLAQAGVFGFQLTQGLLQGRTLAQRGLGNPFFQGLDFTPDPIEILGEESNRHGSSMCRARTAACGG